MILSHFMRISSQIFQDHGQWGLADRVNVTVLLFVLVDMTATLTGPRGELPPDADAAVRQLYRSSAGRLAGCRMNSHDLLFVLVDGLAGDGRAKPEHGQIGRGGD
jgi:hypothetical protein